MILHHPLARLATLGLLLAGSMAMTSPGRAAAATCESWSPEPPDLTNATGTVLNSVSATSTCNAWAVGRYTTAHSAGKTLVFRWNGTKWVHETSLQVPDSEDILWDVAAWSSENAWAVGNYATGGGSFGLILRRRPADRSWQNVSFQGQNQSAVLYGASASSASNAFAVGAALGHVPRSFIVHWNGVHWVKQPAPDVRGGSNILNDVVAVSPTAAWAVGQSSATPGGIRPLILRWNGTAWKAPALPTLPAGAKFGHLVSVDALSATNVWAVGNYQLDLNDTPFVYHWNGTKWKLETLPDAGQPTDISGVAVGSASNVWAVGSSTDDTVIFHWNGNKWILEHGMFLGQVSLIGVAADGPSGAWAVGTRYDGTTTHPFALHCC